MFKVENTVVIQKSVDEVFAFVNNPDNTTKWQGGVEAVKHDGGTSQVGAQYTEVRKFMGREMNTIMEVTAFEVNNKYTAKVVKGPVAFDVDVTFTAEGGNTKMTTIVQGEPGGFFKLAENMVAKQLKESLEEDGKRLKSLLEGS